MTLEEAKMTIYANCIYACEKAGFDLSTICMVDDALRTVIAIADRKTESNSEKPNNCEDEPQYDFSEYADRLWKIAYERGKREALEQTEPTISKMEQVDEPQTELVRVKYHCINCAENGSYKCSKCDGETYYKYDKDEPQTEPLHTCSVNGRPYSECSSCEHFKCTADEPQTDCAWR